MVAIEETTVIHAPVERCFDLARGVEVHLLGNVHGNEQAVAAGGVTAGLVGLGQRVTWRARHLGFRHTLTTEITRLERPAVFRDVQVQGIFRWMQHDHYFRAISARQTEMRDVFCFAAPIPLLGRLAEIVLLGRYMRGLLRERNAVIREVAESSGWERYMP